MIYLTISFRRIKVPQGQVFTLSVTDNIIVAATQNRHKIKEIEAITAKFGMSIVARDEAGVPPVEIVEDGETFEENSFKKAFEIMKLCGKPTIADDSGLEVDCLDGAPGIYSARFAEMTGWPESVELENMTGENEYVPGPEGIDSDNNRKLIELIKDVPYENRKARFVSVITMVFPNEETLVARGTVEGHVIPEERGDGGFGYDPLFIPDGYDRTFGQLPAELKNNISHRANALKKLEQLLLQREESLNE